MSEPRIQWGGDVDNLHSMGGAYSLIAHSEVGLLIARQLLADADCGEAAASIEAALKSIGVARSSLGGKANSLASKVQEIVSERRPQCESCPS